MDSTPFHSLSLDEQRDAIGVAAGESGRPPHLLEKDIWVVQILQNLFATEYGGALTFKGGTSLSKAYNAIRRFSEDIDITYDIRAIAADLVEKNNGSPIPPTTSQAGKWPSQIRERLAEWVSRPRDAPGKWTSQIRERLAEWVSCEMAPAIASQLDEAELAAEVKVEVIEDTRLTIRLRSAVLSITSLFSAEVGTSDRKFSWNSAHGQPVNLVKSDSSNVMRQSIFRMWSFQRAETHVRG